MTQLLRPFRFVFVIICMFIYLGNMALVFLVVYDHWKRVRWSNRILKQYCRLGLWVLRVKVNYLGLENVRSVPNALFVGNHLSYMDVLVIHAEVPACFVTSREIREMPVLGQICLLAGCLFVERRNKHNILNEVSEISEGLRRGANVAIFPEATSTNGEKILRFRRPLYHAAIQAPAAIIPMTLNYHTVGGKKIDRVTRDSIFWYGDMDFVSHLWRLAGCGGVVADLIFATPIHPTPEQDATALAEASQRAVEAVFQPV